MIDLVKRMLERQSQLELRGEPWIYHVDELAACTDFTSFKLPMLTVDEYASTPRKVAIWVRNGQCTLLMDVAIEANNEQMIKELQKNYINLKTLKEVVPQVELYLRSFGLTRRRINFAKTGAGIRITRNENS